MMKRNYQGRKFLIDPPNLKAIGWKAFIDDNEKINAEFHIAWGSSFVCLHNDNNKPISEFIEKLEKIKNNLNLMIKSLSNDEEHQPMKEWLNPEDSVFTGSVAWAIKTKNYPPGEECVYFEIASCDDKIRIWQYQIGRKKMITVFNNINNELLKLKKAVLLLINK